MRYHFFTVKRLLLVAVMMIAVASLLDKIVLAAQLDPCDLRADLNADQVVSMADIQLVASAWGTNDPVFDLDGDSKVTVLDIMAVVKDLGRHTCPFGISMAGEFDNGAMRNAVFDAGARWTRTAVYWSSVEPSNADLTDPSYSGWGWSDIYLKAAITDGLTPVVILWSTPSWAADPSMPASYQECGPFSTFGLGEWAEFVSAFAKRYDGDRDLDNDGIDDIPANQEPMPNIRYVEVFNEPEFDYEYVTNNSLPDDHEGGCWGHDGGAAQYAEALRVAYQEMTAANPTLQLVFGALAYERFTNPTRPTFVKDPVGVDGPFRYDFLDRVLQYLYSKYPGDHELPFFHVLSFHNYNDFRNNWDGWRPNGTREAQPAFNNNEVIGKANHIRAVKLAPYGLADIPLICSECSLASGPADTWTLRDETLQSIYPSQVIARSMAAGLLATMWYTLVDPTTSSYEYGLLRTSIASDAKPAYAAYQVATDNLAGATFDKQLPQTGTDGTGSAGIEAYRFIRPDGSKLILLWTDNDERIGRVGASTSSTNMTFTHDHFGTWTGKLKVVERDGSTTTLSGSSSITVPIGESPKYVYVVP